MNLVLRHAKIMTVDEEQTILEDGCLVIEGQTIAYIGHDTDLPMQYLSFEALDCTDMLVMPSLINSHTHTGMIPFRSLGDDIADRLRRFLLPLERACMTKELAQASAAVAIAEMQLAGIGCAVDMYFYEKSIAEVAQKMGFRLFGGETIMTESPCNTRSEEQALSYADELDKSQKDNPYYQSIYAAHAPYSVTEQTLQAISNLAQMHGRKWTMHLSEMDFELQHFASRYNMTPIQYMEKLGVLDENLVAVHCIHTTDADLQLLAKNDTAVVHCPGANTKAGKGVARISEMIRLGIPVCLGTDGPSSGNTLDMFTQMKLCAILQKNEQRDRTLLPANQVVPMATRTAARVLGIGELTGSLEIGKQADILILGLDDPNTVPCFDPYSVVVYSAGTQNVKHLFTRGEWVVKNHQLTKSDFKEIRKTFLHEAIPFFEEARKRLD